MVRVPGRGREAAGRCRLPLRRRHLHDHLPRRRAGEAAAGRGAGGRRQDRAGQGGRPRDRAPSWCGCSATRVSTRRGRCTSGTTRSSCCVSRPPGDQSWDETHDDIFTDEFLLTRPLLTAIRREEPTVLLVDEVDKTDVEVEGLLLEVLSDFQVTIPEMGTVAATPTPARRAHLQRDARAVRGDQATLPVPAHRLPRGRARARDRASRRCPRSRRSWPARSSRWSASCGTWSCARRRRSRRPIDWARTLVALGTGTLDEAAIDQTLGVVLKHASDHERAVRELRLRSTTR